MNTTPARRTVLQIDGIHLDSFARPYVVVIERILEEQPPDSWPKWKSVSERKSLCDYASAMVSEAIEDAPRHWIRGFFERLSAVLVANRDYILGEEGLSALAVTADDRRLAEAIARGAVMDPETGIVHGFDD